MYAQKIQPVPVEYLETLLEAIQAELRAPTGLLETPEEVKAAKELLGYYQSLLSQ
jgi:hypothetical protein